MAGKGGSIHGIREELLLMLLRLDPLARESQAAYAAFAVGETGPTKEYSAQRTVCCGDNGTTQTDGCPQVFAPRPKGPGGHG